MFENEISLVAINIIDRGHTIDSLEKLSMVTRQINSYRRLSNPYGEMEGVKLELNNV